jgi:hypothetical protein
MVEGNDGPFDQQSASSSFNMDFWCGGWQFPLLSKSECLNKIMKGEKGINKDEVVLPDFPGSVESFEMCAKFCYGITFTLNAYNVGAVRCGAEYLEMSEAIEKGNLIFKLEVFLNSSILRGWKDCIICLQNSKSLVPWAEDLKVSLLIG